jgi:hypothetical protein
MNESAFGAAPDDLDLTRLVLLHLSLQERSPPEAIFVSLSEFGARWGVSPNSVASALEFLSMRDLIEGPGRFYPDFFLFRKLTRKGRALAQAIDRPRDWKALKDHYLTS